MGVRVMSASRDGVAEAELYVGPSPRNCHVCFRFEPEHGQDCWRTQVAARDAEIARLRGLLDRCPEWPHEHGDCLLDGDLNADKCVSCAFNRELLAIAVRSRTP